MDMEHGGDQDPLSSPKTEENDDETMSNMVEFVEFPKIENNDDASECESSQEVSNPDESPIVFDGKPDPKKRYFCCLVEGCGAFFNKEDYLRTHFNSVHTRPVKCPFAGCRSYVKQKNLNRHVKAVHQNAKASTNGNVTCGICKSSFSNRIDLTRHSAMAHKEKSHNPASTSSVQAINADAPAEYCPNCGIMLSKCSLKTHLDRCTNDGQKRFICLLEGCDVAFTTVANREAHMRRIHQPLVECPHEGCGLVFKSHRLAMHVRTVHENQKAVCDNCGNEFNIEYVRKHRSICSSLKGKRRRKNASQKYENEDVEICEEVQMPEFELVILN